VDKPRPHTLLAAKTWRHAAFAEVVDNFVDITLLKTDFAAVAAAWSGNKGFSLNEKRFKSVTYKKPCIQKMQFLGWASLQASVHKYQFELKFKAFLTSSTDKSSDSTTGARPGT